MNRISEPQICIRYFGKFAAIFRASLSQYSVLYGLCFCCVFIAGELLKMRWYFSVFVRSKKAFDSKESKASTILAVWTRLELATPCVTGMYSNQLNYQTKIFNDLFLLRVSNQNSTFGGLDETRTRDPMRDRHVF